MQTKIFLKKNKEISVKRFHRWIYSGAVEKIKGKHEEGDIVEVYDSNNNFLSVGHFQSESITVRILSFEKEEINIDFWRKKIRNAIELRKKLGFFKNKSTNMFRLINGEGDDLPGLIIDYYNGLVVIQCYSAGMFRNIEMIAEALKNELKNDLKAIYNKSSLKLPVSFKTNIEDGFIFGKAECPIETSENNNIFLVDFINGQKTGFFLDQRDNRQLISNFAYKKEVANLYGFSGGFSVYAAKAEAKSVITVDSSESALELASKNYSLNKIDNIVKNEKADVIDFLKKNDKKYDIIILDPPAFAKHHSHKEKALKKYKNINRLALSALNKNGILFSFSCSKTITANDLKQAVFVAAASSKKNLKIIHQLHQPCDHPLSIYNPESEHLKGFVFFVE